MKQTRVPETHVPIMQNALVTKPIIHLLTAEYQLPNIVVQAMRNTLIGLIMSNLVSR